jgi:hypothetical protein
MDFMGTCRCAKDRDRKRAEWVEKHDTMIENLASQKCQENLASYNYLDGLLN